MSSLTAELLRLSARASPVVLACITAGILLWAAHRGSTKGACKDRHRRGTVLEKKRVTRRRLPHATIAVAGIRVAPEDEAKHFKIIGATGTGKSTAIRQLLGAALERGDRAIIADPDGGYCARFFSRYRGDLILNPFEPQSLKWDLFAEIRTRPDIDQLASALIPDSADAAANEWRSYARVLLAAVLRHCHQKGRRGSSNLWRLLMMSAVEELRVVVRDSPAQPLLEAENLRMFSSIRSVMGASIAAYEYVERQRAAEFSVRRWVREADNAGVLFIPYNAGQIPALRSMIATWLHLAIFEAMSAAEDRDQRLWFIADELDALGRIHGLKDALARLRKFGGRCVLGFQSIAQVSCTYGEAEAQTIVENCGNTLILRCSSSEKGGTSHFASRLIGDREILRRQHTYGSDREGAFVWRTSRRSRSISEQCVTESAVMASELEQLADLCGFFKAASSPRWVRVDFRLRGGFDKRSASLRSSG